MTGLRGLLALITCALALPAHAEDANSVLFGNKCAGCHGADGRAQTPYGQKHPMPHFSSGGWQKGVTDAVIAKTIHDGIVKDDQKLMPAFGEKLTAAQITGLVGFVRTLQQ